MRVHLRWVAMLAGLGALGVLSLPVGLRAAGRFLVVQDPLAPAEAIFVFPGEIPQRARCAARLWRRGVAPAIVVSGGRVAPVLEAIGMPFTDAELNAQVLRDVGVPRAAVHVLPEGTSTQEDALALRRWAAEREGVQRLIAVTSPAHSRRARSTLQRVLGDTGIDVRVRACPPVLGSDWWRHESSFLRVMNEYLKLFYYALVY